MLRQLRTTHPAVPLAALAALVLCFAAPVGAIEPDDNAADGAERHGEYRGQHDGKHDGKHHGKRHGKRRGDRGGPGAFEARYADELGLDEDVRAKIQQVVADSRLRNEALRDELDAARRQIRQLLRASEPDEVAVMTLADERADIEAELHKNRLQALLDIRGLLTSEQRAQLVELRAQRREGRDRNRDRHGSRACRRDMKELCAAAEDGQATLGCLHAGWNELSQSCRDAFEGGPPAPPEGEMP